MPEQTRGTIEVLTPGRPVWVTLNAAVTHRCPVDGTADADHLEVTYHAGQGIIEVSSFEAYLDGFDPMAVTIEELVEMVAADLAVLGIPNPVVKAWGEHGERTNVEVRTHLS